MNGFTTALGAALAACLSFHSTFTSAYYMPGVRPQTFYKGDEIPLKVNALTSIHTQIPKPYYRLPFCLPEGGPLMASQNLGQFLTGNKIQTSPYTINMATDVYCQKLCQRMLDSAETAVLREHILYGYHHNWIVDNMPSASIVSTEYGQQKRYAGGFPVGFIDKSKNSSEKIKDVYIFNHVNIFLDYHEPQGMENQFRVVGFSVEPLSIAHRFYGGFQWDGVSTDGYTKLLQTCTNGQHMSKADIPKNQIVKEGEKVLFTYDVIWRKSDVEWASRWDIYLSEGYMVPAQVHWYSIINSIFVVLFLSLLVVSILVRNLKRDIHIAGHNAGDLDNEADEEVDGTGWKLLHADVFRPPSNMPMVYCVFIGSGVQLGISALCAIILAAIGFINPSRRGSMINWLLIFYMLCGVVAGYTSSRLYKAFRGREWQVCTFATATLFPGSCFAVLLFFNTAFAFFGSSGSVPFLDILTVAAMWCCVSIPLVFIGAHFGYKEEAIHFPTVTSTIARAIPPPSNIFKNPTFGIIIAGLLPLRAAYVELFFIMTSLWMDQFYIVHGFILIVYIILLVTSSEITVLLVYYQLVSENHRWWWLALLTSGSIAFYIFGYSVIWFQSLQPSKLLFTYILYFGYMFLLSFAVFLVTGAVGALTSLWFVRKMFGSIKVDENHNNQGKPQRLDLINFFHQLPKIELHAHLNGCIRESTLLELARERNVTLSPLLHDLQIGSSSTVPASTENVPTTKINTKQRSLPECFEIFAEIAKCVTDLVALRRITKEALEDFAVHNVKYLELRSTPKILFYSDSDCDDKGVTRKKATKKDYIDTILRVFEEFENSNSAAVATTTSANTSTSQGIDIGRMIPRYIVSVNRAESIDDAMENAALAIEYKKQNNKYIVGLDLSGNPFKVSKGCVFLFDYGFVCVVLIFINVH